MSSAEEEVRLSMRVMVNKEKTKVLFGIVDNNLADIMLSFLTLPLGRIIRLLEKHYGDHDEAPVVGSLSKLYKGLINLDSSHFWTEEGKLMLLDPRSSLADECRKLKININDDQPQILFRCEYSKCVSKKENVTMYFDTQRCSCGKLISVQIGMRGSNSTQVGEVFTAESMSFLISDDLRMWPNVIGSIVHIMNELGITDTVGAEEMTVTVGFNEIMDLLKGSLLSRTPLTDLILGKKQIHHSSSIAKSEPITLPPPMEIGETTSIVSKKMKVKAMVQKSTNKFLFVQAEEDFVDFLFSFLTIPLGKVESLFGSNTSLGRIDNLYRSIENLNADKYLKTACIKYMLLNPVLPPMYLSKNQIFSLTEQESPQVYYLKKNFYFTDLPRTYYHSNQWVHLKDPKGKESYVKGPKMFMVTDDLTVTPLCMLSTISTLNELRIPFSDVEERELDVGLEEGLSILKASLTSTSSLTNGMIHISKKQPKQEHIHQMKKPKQEL
ncbi:hypothetical protein ACJIZ3_019228 [Penstemon smallii]|uniref:Uncharacterized protein n=1 Tax=Penstemon smallii TaxID=265156 RepID=A0ABD3T1E2_9LAMI